MKVTNSLLALACLSGLGVYAAPQAEVSAAAPASQSVALEGVASPEVKSALAIDSGDTVAAMDATALTKYQPTTLNGMKAKYRRHVVLELLKKGLYGKCNLTKVQVRREWGSMSAKDRISYTDAVKCLHAKSPRSDPKAVPGARSRFDDFVAAHIEEAYSIHFSGNLLPWHRAYTWNYEQALRNECGYKGAQPYWDWSKYYQDPAASPLFDGSATSIGGNGEAIVHGATLLRAFGLEISLPPGSGGGCVQTGPFADFQVNLGLTPPVPQPLQRLALPIPVNDTNSEASSSALDYNPRCLTRDFNTFWSEQTKTSDVEFLLSCSNVECLEKRADGWELPGGVPQPILHAAGHFTIGGLANDPFASPGDPAFYFHHAQFDHVWAIWQAQDPKNRQKQIAGTSTPFNNPPSAPITLQEPLRFGAAAKATTINNVMDTLDGDFCYVYA